MEENTTNPTDQQDSQDLSQETSDSQELQDVDDSMDSTNEDEVDDMNQSTAGEDVKSAPKKRTRTNPARQRKVFDLLAGYREPVLLSEFVQKHSADMDLSNSEKGRHAATVYINRMVTQGKVLKTKEGRFPYISLPASSTPSPVAPLRKAPVRTGKKTVSAPLHPEERRSKIMALLTEYNKSVPLSEFITTHVEDLGYVKTAKNLATLRAFLYRMSDKGTVLLQKIEKNLFLSLNQGKKAAAVAKPVATEPEVAVKTSPAEAAPVPRESAPKPSGTAHSLHLPLSLETLIETKNKLMETMEDLDRQLEDIIEKKKVLKLKRDELLNKIRELF
jgi:hypothetical protein